MLTYEYECETCGLRFEREQSIKEEPLAECPACHEKVHRLISGGSGLILKERGDSRIENHGGGCSLDQTGKTCCGRDDRCGKPPCGEGS